MEKHKWKSLAPRLQQEPYNIPLEADCITNLREAIERRATLVAEFDTALRIVDISGATKERVLEILMTNEFEEVEGEDTEISEVAYARATKYMGA